MTAPLNSLQVDSHQENFERLWSAFEDACRRKPGTTAEIGIGEWRWRLRFADPSLAGALVPALDHLVVPSEGDPDLEVGLWSWFANGDPFPLLRFDAGDVIRHGCVRSDDGTIRFVFDSYFHLVIAVDDVNRRALYAVPDASAIPGWERAAPLRYLVNSWFAGRGLQMVHAGCLARGERGALIAGPGGSGKSTTSLLASQSGLFDYLADDYCLVAPSQKATAYSLFNSAKLHAADLSAFPNLRPHFVIPDRQADGEKPVVFLSRVSRVRRSCPIDAIYLPEVTDSEETRIHPVPRRRSFEAIAPSTAEQLLGAEPKNLALIAALAAGVPAFRLELGRDRNQIPQRLATHLDSFG